MQRIIYLDTCMIDPYDYLHHGTSFPASDAITFLGGEADAHARTCKLHIDWLMPTQLSSTMIMPVIDAGVIIR